MRSNYSSGFPTVQREAAQIVNWLCYLGLFSWGFLHHLLPLLHLGEFSQSSKLCTFRLLRGVGLPSGNNWFPSLCCYLRWFSLELKRAGCSLASVTFSWALMRPIWKLRLGVSGIILCHTKDWKTSLAYLGRSSEPKGASNLSQDNNSIAWKENSLEAWEMIFSKHCIIKNFKHTQNNNVTTSLQLLTFCQSFFSFSSPYFFLWRCDTSCYRILKFFRYIANK